MEEKIKRRKNKPKCWYREVIRYNVFCEYCGEVVPKDEAETEIDGFYICQRCWEKYPDEFSDD